MGKIATMTLTAVLFTAFFGLLFLLGAALEKNPRALNSVVTGRKIRIADSATTDNKWGALILPRLDNGEPTAAGELPTAPYLLNIWGTWCDACHREHPYLMQLSRRMAIVGINWPAGHTEERENALAFLTGKGNPYTLVLSDTHGKTIIDLGVYGAPETFLIGANGKILHRHAGALTPLVWEKEFAPLLVK